MTGEDIKSIEKIILENPSFKDLSQEEIDEEIVSLYTSILLLFRRLFSDLFSMNR